ncbi:YmfL family putative regulatory protein [Rosenbergiella nectarea]|uniref:YmfL family putative regulatory protein n=1 Tax=Rosenbergiella nectarea TaxID=988801 RepID=UPI001F4E719A
MDQKNWKVEKQPDWYIKSVKKTITELPGGYAEAAEWLGVTENSLFNRLRADGDQVFPMGWVAVLEKAGNTNFVSHAVAKAAGGVFVPVPDDLDEIDNADINQRLLEALEQVSAYSKQVRDAISDGVVEKHEKEAIEQDLYQVISKLQEHSTLVYQIFCKPEKVNAPSCSSGRSIATKSLCGESIA